MYKFSKKEHEMNRNTFIAAATGFVLGIVVVGVALMSSASSMMIKEDVSSMDFEETVQRIQDAAAKVEWKVPAVHRIDKSVAKAGYDVLPVAVIELCKPEHAGKLLVNDDNRIISSLMPCRVAVYQASDGRVIISRMNTALMSKLFSQDVADVMAAASSDTEKIFAEVFK